MAAKTPTFEMPEELGNDWGTFRENAVVRAKQQTEKFTLKGDKTKYDEGSYIVYSGKGKKVKVLSDEEFSAKYVPVSPAKSDTNFAPAPQTP